MSKGEATKTHSAPFIVMPGLDPGIRASTARAADERLDRRVKPGDDSGKKSVADVALVKAA
ncbi:MAG: hypothetical protein AB7S71_01940 [Dongiaceae bacterium]